MAEKIVKTATCDKCKKEINASKEWDTFDFLLFGPATIRVGKVDLCPECAAEVLTLLNKCLK